MFEVHITTNTIQETAIEQFKAFCTSIEAKPILIELPEGVVVQQPMISKVFTDVIEGQLTNQIEALKAKFIEHSYEVIRTKVEVPLTLINRGRKEFPDYRGQYYEWHGKVEFEDLEQLKKTLIHFRNAHISKNALKDQVNRRFVTVRSYHHKRMFLNNVDSVKQNLSQHGFKLIKDEYEYCIYDSNKATDKGWMDIPEITDSHYLNLLAFEGFLRRIVDKPEKFILKGSLLTRQYLKDINVRDALDLDFIYGNFIDDDVNAGAIFTSWLTKVTESDEPDNVVYKSFKENEFWRSIDYAMHDDFPTTNTDLSCHVKDYEIPVVGLDISWNLPLDEEPIPLVYEPQEGDSFIIPFTVPLPTQIAWKLHQSIVRPRAKDLIDIILLLDSNEITKEQIAKLSEVFINECHKDQIDALRIEHYSTGAVSKFLIKHKGDLDESHNNYWLLKTPFGFEITSTMKLSFLDDIFKIDLEFDNVQGLTEAFEECLRESGIADKVLETYKGDDQKLNHSPPKST